VIFRQLFDTESSTYTYLLACPEKKCAALIDPVYERHQRDRALLKELGLWLKYTLETHVHADHVTGGWLMKKALGSELVISDKSGAEGADLYVADGDVVDLGTVQLEVRATPGHTDGCTTFVTTDQTMAFTGDALLIRGAGRTDFQQGSAATLFRSVKDKILSLPDACLLYPGHDYQGRTVTTVAEEKAHNPRIGGDASEGDFVGFMDNLGLPHPKKLDVAVPANLKSGQPEDAAAPQAPSWGPVERSYAGIPEIDAAWVAEHRGALTLVDVREPDELTGELGHIDDVTAIPLGELRERTADVPEGKPIIAVCRSGRRSAQAALILEKAGRQDVANLTGGMLRWRARGFPVAQD
jgi:glyoxylase-like metal-dependent hydrolase (beta-lactamase superfamily II)/rhodanese-related sulfurtransferase